MQTTTPFIMLVALVGVLAAGCGPTDTPYAVACTMDAKICPDGTTVGRVPPDCEFAPCPTTPESTFKEYLSQDVELCTSLRFSCDGDEMFSDEAGCGCIREHQDPAVTLCAAEFNPVCGWFNENIQCITEPCAETKANLCMASLDENVAYTTPGSCPGIRDEPQVGFCDPNDRPEVCTREYMPVCGDDGVTYGNACTACASDTVFEYTQGACEEEEPAEERVVMCEDPRSEFCTMQYDPVCATKRDGTTSTYGNGCVACSDTDVINYTPGMC